MNNKKYIEAVTMLDETNETVDLFQIIESPCVMCGGLAQEKCKFCLGKDNVIILRNTNLGEVYTK